MILASLLAFAAALLVVPPATAQILPCFGEPCEEECIPNFQLVTRQVISIEFVKKKDNGVCVYECDAYETFSDFAQCVGSEDFTVLNGYRVRPNFGTFPCPGDPDYPYAGPANPGMCCDTDPPAPLCTW
jgi:hypothetical protein